MPYHRGGAERTLDQAVESLGPGHKTMHLRRVTYISEPPFPQNSNKTLYVVAGRTIQDTRAGGTVPSTPEML